MHYMHASADGDGTFIKELKAWFKEKKKSFSMFKVSKIITWG